MDLDTLTEQIRAIQDWMTRDGPGRLADPGALGVRLAALIHGVEELRVAGEERQRQDDAIRAWRRAQEEERARYQDLFEHAPDAYLVTDPQGVIREANRKAVDLFNLRRGFLIGK